MFYKPLTPAFRDTITVSIDSQIRELSTCNRNALVSSQIIGLQVFRNMIRALPDGYPIPVERTGKQDER